MEKAFTEPDVDRGENRIITKQSNIMHALWDGLLGREFDLADAPRRIFEITSDQEIVANARHEGLCPSVWIFTPINT